MSQETQTLLFLLSLALVWVSGAMVGYARGGQKGYTVGWHDGLRAGRGQK